ncbi:hypothetical protein F7725_017914 [Dissostichus mawsoni]|uniref:Uncharacterized protein n=1 Tax=Dissostichus mawsoni TaxID=36200 RepID=A0A7J5XRK9_DISMA|nr:hypothetical protein F7725_017914 [Dissostichus mawsoni]
MTHLQKGRRWTGGTQRGIEPVPPPPPPPAPEWTSTGNRRSRGDDGGDDGGDAKRRMCGEPHFLHAIEYGNYVYFFLSEIAVEYTTLGKVLTLSQGVLNHGLALIALC